MACIQEFSGERLSKYLNRTYQILTGEASSNELQKIFLHICLAHVMNIIRKQALKIFRRDSESNGKVHFTLCFLGCLISSPSLSEASELVLHRMNVMTTEYTDKHVLDLLHFVETAINNLKATKTKDPL